MKALKMSEYYKQILLDSALNWGPDVSLDKIHSTLKKARGILDTKGWIRKKWAADNEGKTVNPLDPTASAFCMQGAICLAADVSPVCAYDHKNDLMEASCNVLRNLNMIPGTIQDWNDCHIASSFDVLDAFDKALEILEKYVDHDEKRSNT